MENKVHERLPSVIPTKPQNESDKLLHEDNKTQQTHKPAKIIVSTRKDSSDNDESSYTSEEDDGTLSDITNEHFNPLSFGFTKGCPTRQAGIPTPKHTDTRFFTAVSDSDESDLSLSDSPLSVEINKGVVTRRACGSKNAILEETISYDSSDEISDSSEEVSIEIDTRKCYRKAGPCATQAKSEVTLFEEGATTSSEDEEDQPLNAKTILNLVRRFHDLSNQSDVSPDEFHVVDWSDKRFRMELQPLRELFHHMEELKEFKNLPKDLGDVTTKELELKEKIENLVRALPQESAIVAKIKKINIGNIHTFRNKVSTQSKTTQENAEMALPKADVELHAPSLPVIITTGSKKSRKPKVIESGEAITESAAREKKVLRSSIILGSSTLSNHANETCRTSGYDDASGPTEITKRAKNERKAIKEAVMSEKATKVFIKRKRLPLGRSVSFIDTGFPELEEEIKEREEDIVMNDAVPTENTHRSHRAKKIFLSDDPCTDNVVSANADDATRIRRHSRKGHHHMSKRQDEGTENNVTSFEKDLQDPQKTILNPTEEEAATKVKRRSRHHLPRRDESDAAAAISGVVVRSKKSRVQSDMAVPSNHDEVVAPSKGERRTRKHYVRRNRELSVSKLDDIIAGEIFEKTEDTNIPITQTILGETHGTIVKGHTEHRPPVLAQKRISVNYLNGKEVLEANNMVIQEALQKTFPPKIKKRKKRKFASQELSVSAIPDEKVGEIVENDKEFFMSRRPTLSQASLFQNAHDPTSPQSALLPSINSGLAHKKVSDA